MSAKEVRKAKRGSWICSKGHSTGGRASVCKVCGEQKPARKQKQQKVNADLRDVVKLVAELGGVGTLKQLIADAKQVEAKLAPFGGILGAEQAIADLATLETALHDAAR